MFFINVLEASIFTYFVASCFELSKKYFYITTIIHLLILYFFSAIHNEGLILSMTIVVFMIVSVIVATKKISFNYFYIIILYESLLFSCDFFGVLLLNICIAFNFPLNLSLIILNIVVKLLLIGITLIALKLKREILISLDIKKWFLVILFEIMIISAVSLLTYELFIQKYSLYTSLSLLVILNIMSVLFLVIIYRIHLMNLNVVESSRLHQLKQFNEEKLNTINHIKNDVDSLEHRMLYVLLKTKYSIENGDLTNASQTIDTYINSISKNKFVISTNNTVFDSIVGMKINELKLNDIDINISIFISENQFYDNLFFINTLIQLFDQFVCVKYINIQIEEIDENVKVKLIYKDGSIHFDEIKQILDKTDKIDYNITDYNEKGFRLLFKMCDYE